MWIVPKHFFVPEIVEKRKPLSATARRAGWTGSNILFDEIPIQGRISIIRNRVMLDKEAVISQVKRSTLLSATSVETRSWLFDVLNCVNKIQSQVFSLHDVYAFEEYLSEKHPQITIFVQKCGSSCRYCAIGDFLSLLDAECIKKQQDNIHLRSFDFTLEWTICW